MSDRDLFKLTGITVAEKYAVEDVVLESSYAVVYRARELRSGLTVALQVFKVLGEYGEDARRRLLQAFLDRGNRLGRLAEQAPALRLPRDIGPMATRDGRWVPFMALEWIEGSPLEALLRTERSAGVEPRPLAAALSFLDPIATALDALHAHGLAHLDVTPLSIFVTPSAASDLRSPLRLLDFGTAHVVSHALLSGPDGGAPAIAPTYLEPAYAAPEQLVSPGPPTGPWTDVFSLAVILTEMITGRPTARGADVGVLTTAPRPTPRALGVDVGDAVDAVFARALSADHRQRPQTAGELWTAARQALAQPPISLRPMRAQVRTSPDLAREKVEAEELAHRSPRLLIVTVTLLLVGMAVGLLFAYR